ASRSFRALLSFAFSRSKLSGDSVARKFDELYRRVAANREASWRSEMPEEIEVETKDLQETIEELQEERKERAESERRTAWTRYIALTTAILAVFAAVAALRAGTLVNEAVLRQLKASDTWNEYQADRTKDHLYSIQVN